MQKEMNIDALPAAIAYEVKQAHVEHRTRGFRSASVTSNATADTIESDIDLEILINDLEVSDSPILSLRKKFAP